MRAAFVIGCFLLGAAVSYFFEPYVYRNADAVGIFVTVYTVFAGFLVAVITVLGDPSILPSGDWKGAETHREQVEKRIIRHVWLFVLYLVTIGLIFASTLLNKAPDTAVPAIIKHSIAYAHLWLGVSAFFLSLGLPKMLMDVQRRRVEAEIERRRHEAGIKD